MKTTFRRVALIGKKTPEIAQSLRALRRVVEKRGCTVVADGRRADLAIVIGGDGTMLAAARELARHGVPLAGINRGRLGFMTDIALSEMKRSVGAILDGRHSVEARALL